MAIAKELLDKLNDTVLAREVDSASVYVKIIVAAWDGLADAEVSSLESQMKATLLDEAEVKGIFQDQLRGICAGESVEDNLLVKVKDTMAKVPETQRSDIGRALFDEALTILGIDKILSGQEREVVKNELAPVLGISADEATVSLDKVAAELKTAKNA